MEKTRFSEEQIIVVLREQEGLPQGPNQRLSLDFVSDTLACGSWIRVVVVDVTREDLPLVPDAFLLAACR